MNGKKTTLRVGPRNLPGITRYWETERRTLKKKQQSLKKQLAKVELDLLLTEDGMDWCRSVSGMGKGERP